MSVSTLQRMIVHTNCKVTVPAGTYILGDPAYSTGEKGHDQLHDTTNAFANPVGEVDGYQILTFKTDHGDGIYNGPYACVWTIPR